MKTQYKLTYKHLMLLVLPVSVIFFISSCKKNSEESNNPKRDGTYLSIDIKGIIEGKNVQMGKVLNRVKTSSAAIAVDPAMEEMENSNGVDALVSVTQDLVAVNADSKSVNSGEQKASANETKAAVTYSLMSTNVKYRILITTPSGQIVYNKEATPGVDPGLDVVKGGTYNWYAYSINEATVPAFDGATGKIAVADLVNKDLVWDSGTITAVEGENYMAIEFMRQTARYIVHMDSRGMFGPMEDDTQIRLVDLANPTGQVVQMADFDIKTGLFDMATVQDHSSMLAGAMHAHTLYGNADKIATFYTINHTPILANNLQIKIVPLKITLDDGRTRTFDAADDLKYKLKDAVSPTKGSSHTAGVRLIESGVKVNNLIWARTNLKYDASRTFDNYRVNGNSLGSSQATWNIDLWNYNAITPTSGVTLGLDACKLIYPEGVWRLASMAEMNALAAIPFTQSMVTTPGVGTSYGYIWQLDAGYKIQDAYDENRLFLPFGGIRPASSQTVEYCPTCTQTQIQFNYWSGDNQNASKAWAFKSGVNSDGTTWTGITESAENKNNGRNIRCVRAKTNPTS